MFFGCFMYLWMNIDEYLELWNRYIFLAYFCSLGWSNSWLPWQREGTWLCSRRFYFMIKLFEIGEANWCLVSRINHLCSPTLSFAVLYCHHYIKVPLFLRLSVYSPNYIVAVTKYAISSFNRKSKWLRTWGPCWRKPLTRLTNSCGMHSKRRLHSFFLSLSPFIFFSL